MTAHHDHLLRLDGVDEYRSAWRLTCHHGPGEYVATLEDGVTPDPDWNPEECVIADWWDLLGPELLDIKGEVTTLPLPVKPDWLDRDALTIVRADL